MLFDPDNTTVTGLRDYLADERDRLNFPEMWHRFCTTGALALLERRAISQPDCVEFCELADAGLDCSLEIHATWPRGWDIRLSYELTCPLTGNVWATSGGPSFVRPELGRLPVGQFSRRGEGRIHLVDMRQEQILGVFVTPTTAEIEGRLYEMVLAGEWDGRKVVPLPQSPTTTQIMSVPSTPAVSNLRKSSS
ncbi:hypothetical protein [Ectopseudomonas oleovorans]|uniref:Uncharacterized protein n=1 Tax=Ectopseudomonas oleovorans TaxID=301 RepID=A0A3D9EXI7_ECTOL|nr:hypothetical protein [Pseudomonas oleovorans]RED07010.1 hypothetical protein DFO60_1516 [Pseudomonas oleovorans]